MIFHSDFKIYIQHKMVKSFQKTRLKTRGNQSLWVSYFFKHRFLTFSPSPPYPNLLLGETLISIICRRACIEFSKCYFSPGYLHFQPYLFVQKETCYHSLENVQGSLHVNRRILFLSKGLVTSRLKTVQRKSQSLFSLASLNIVDQNYQ